MKSRITSKFLLGLAAMAPFAGFATNGDNMIAIGPKSRAMGGLSIAYPQDAITAVFGNPASLCFTKFCPSTQADLGLTLFMPDVSAEVTNPWNPSDTLVANSNDKVYPIPSVGWAKPFGEDNRGRFGIAAYGVSGLGVNYENEIIGGMVGSVAPPGVPAEMIPPMPIIAGSYTSLQIMKVSPSVAWQVAPNVSVGAALHIDYAILDMGTGESDGFGWGVQLGTVYRPTEDTSIGLVYISPQEVKHSGVVDLGQGANDLRLEAPQQLGAGIAYEMDEGRLMVGADIRWINWADATGYKDFDWVDQTVIAIGVQYEAIEDKLVLRAGYNYGKNPVREHNGWNGAFDQMGNPVNTNMGSGSDVSNGLVDVQGIVMPRYFYETFRIIGFPAIVESHLTFGLTYHVNEKMALSLAFMKAMEKDIEESGIGPFGAPTTLKSTLSETSIELGFAWKY